MKMDKENKNALLGYFQYLNGIICKKKILIWTFPSFAKTTFRSGETMFLQMRVGLSAISFALQKEGGQKDAASIPNACKNEV